MTYLAAGAGALGAGLLLLSRSRITLLGGVALIAVAEVALLASASSIASLVALPGSLPALAALGVAAAALAALAALLVRHPIATAPLALAVAPLRPPLEFGGDLGVTLATSGQLGRLLPLYFVLAGAVVALVWRVLRGAAVRALPLVLAAPLAVFAGLAALSLVWALDPGAARDQLAFFWLPFALLAAVVARTPVDARLARLLALALVIPACLYAIVGLGQAAAGEIFFADADLEAGNAYGALFRVTSLFDDPSHYGRHLVLAMAVVLVALWLGRTRTWPALATLGLLGAGLWFSYSQSSSVALVAVALALALVTGERRTRRLAAAATLAIGLVIAGLLAVQLGQGGRQAVTSERSRLAEDTAVVFVNHPVLGVGVASQPLASREEAGAPEALRRGASHSTPLTVASELGTVGLLAYGALLAGAVATMMAARARDPALGFGLGTALLVLFVHSLFYDGFFDNPITWGALGVVAAAAAGASAPVRDRTTSEPEPLRGEREVSVGGATATG